jgi:uncharacterized protein
MNRDVIGSGAVLEEIPLEECLDLLTRTPVGRVGGVAHGRPFVFPINFLFDGDAVVFRTAPGTKLDGAGFGRVAFEIDGVDEETETGWSVIVQGVAAEISDMLDHHSETLRQLDLSPWVAGEKTHWVAIDAESITGRRLARG